MLNLRGKLLVALLVASCIAVVEMGPGDLVTGGLGGERLADEQIREIIESVRESIRARYPSPFTKIEPVKYKVQVVAGKNYYIKAIFHESDGDKIVAHMSIYKHWRGPAELTGLKLNVKHDDPIEYFRD